MYEVKNVKSFIGREGHGFACSVYKDGKKIGEALEPADGGPMDFRWTERISEIELEAHVLTLPKFKVFDEEFDQNIDIFITDLVSKYEFYRDLRKRCKTQWVYKTKEGAIVGYNKTLEYTKAQLEAFPSIKSMILGCINDNMEGVYEWVMSHEEGKKTPLL